MLNVNPFSKRGVLRLALMLLCLALSCLSLTSPAQALEINGDLAGDQYGVPLANGLVSGGVVNMHSGTVTGNVYGGSSRDDDAIGNTVNLYGGTVTVFVFGGNALGTGNANDNNVLLNGATVQSTIYGGDAAGSGGVNGNIVTLRSGFANSGAIGGFANNGDACNNTVNLYSGVTVSRLRGGVAPHGTSSGNTLNIYGWQGSLTELDFFQNYNFYLANTVGNNDTIISVGKAVDISNAAVHVGVMGGKSPLQVGNTVTLIDTGSNGLTATGINSSTSGEGMTGDGVIGISKGFSFDLTYDANSLYAMVTAVGDGTLPQLKSLSESRVAGLGMLTQGADMLHMQGIPQLRANALGTSGPALFGVMGGQSLRYDSGSHVDVDGFNLVTGLGWNFALGGSSSENGEGRNGNLLVGAFFEAGWGSYDSHNSFGNAASVKDDGDTNYYGGGILARYDTAPIGPGNLYLESSIRAGKVETDYDSSDFRSASGGDVDFDSDATYYGAHAGIGYIWNISEASSLDMYTKYLWTRQDSDSVTIQGDRIKFKDMDSHRWRTGARFAHILDTESGLRFTPYVGAAYEHEFDSEAKATSNGDSIDAPDVKGGTGMGELGFSFKPSATSGLSLDLGMQGYTGKREGVGGSFQIKFEF